ncbi:hypothetical protein [Roseateles chitinivorans]|uniref:hypothetical protein n=1 Tax=Roseateles chitinivorans TaxID=2917965 RepID=UPI001303F959|nr:hypothetical protein [Roseateles chitinivorans]
MIVVLPALIVLRVVLRSSPLSLKAPAMPPLVPALTVTALALNWLRLSMSLLLSVPVLKLFLPASIAAWPLPSPKEVPDSIQLGIIVRQLLIRKRIRALLIYLVSCSF